jgi:hypothetical protein
MQTRDILWILAIVIAATLLLVAIAPWINPCVGPLRFVDCVAMENSTAPNALAPWLFCPFGVCDFFPGTMGRAIRIFAVAAVLIGTGLATSRLASRRPGLVGIAAATAAAAGSIALTKAIYAGVAV